MRITSDTIIKVATVARELTGGAFAYGYTSNPGDGVRYVDGVKQHVWTGRTAAREAVAYYLGGIYGWLKATPGADSATLPQWVRDLHADLVMGDRRPAITDQYTAGKKDAESRFTVR